MCKLLGSIGMQPHMFSMPVLQWYQDSVQWMSKLAPGHSTKDWSSCNQKKYFHFSCRLHGHVSNQKIQAPIELSQNTLALHRQHAHRLAQPWAEQPLSWWQHHPSDMAHCKQDVLWRRWNIHSKVFPKLLVKSLAIFLVLYTYENLRATDWGLQKDFLFQKIISLVITKIIKKSSPAWLAQFAPSCGLSQQPSPKNWAGQAGCSNHRWNLPLAFLQGNERKPKEIKGDKRKWKEMKGN